MTKRQPDDDDGYGIRARDLVAEHGDALLGRTVHTIQAGKYPGGPAVITDVSPDPGVPEIAYTVEHPTWGEEYIYGWEMASLLD